MKLKEISFKVTTTDKLVCHRCKNLINGKEGYVKIVVERERSAFASKDTMSRICWNCFEKDLNEIIKKRKTRVEDFDNLMKRRVLTGLR